MNTNPSHNELWRRAATAMCFIDELDDGTLVKGSWPTLNTDVDDDDELDDADDWPMFDEVICVSRSNPDRVRVSLLRRRVDGDGVCDCEPKDAE